MAARRLEHLRGGVVVVDVVNEVPGPGAGDDRPDLEDVVAEGRNDARAELLPLGEHGAEARQEDVLLLLLGRVEVGGQAAAEHEDAVGHA